MTRCERWSFNLLALLVSASGIVFFVTKYFVTNPDPFSIVNHPLQPIALDIHILTSPFLLFVAGFLIAGHARHKRKKKRKTNRLSGNLVQWTMIFMGASGYMLQILTDGTLKQISLILHLATSGLFVIGFSRHFYVGMRARSNKLGKIENSPKRLAA